MSASPASDPSQSATILLVDDDDALLFLLSEQLTAMGHDVVSVSSGVVAWQMVESGLTFDLLLSDVKLPGGLGGFELANKLLAQHPEKAVLLMSGYGQNIGQTPDGVDAEVILKTTPPDALAKKIANALARDKPT